MKIQGQLAAAIAAFVFVLAISVGGASAQTEAPGVPEAAVAPATASDDAALNASDEVTDPITETDDQGPSEEATAPPKPRKAKLNVRLKGLDGSRLTVGKRVKVAGTLRPFRKGERVTVKVLRGKKVVTKRTQVVKLKKKGSKLGQFGFSKKLVRDGRYSVQAIHKRSAKLAGAKDRSRNFGIRYPNLDYGQRNSLVKLLNNKLAALGYVNDQGKAYDAATGRAILAFRKVNNMARTREATSAIFRKVANGKGGYKLKYPGSGKHVEADLSRQVMVLANGDEVDQIYHVSSGKPATPTVRGTWRFYRKEPGLNNVGMYYSVYWYKGYATHGYKSVPTYPASAGCLRNPPADSVRIYNWIDVGDLIHVYE